MKRILPLLLVLHAALACSGPREATIAKIGNERIASSDLVLQMKIEAKKYDAAFLANPANFSMLRDKALEKLIDESILLAEAKAVGISVSPEELARDEKMKAGQLPAAEYMKSIGLSGISPEAWERAQRARLTIEKLIDQEVVDKVPIQEAAVSEYYRKHIDEFRQPAQYHARQIVVDTREQADRILAEIRKGADFQAMAKQYSLSPDGKRGGDLGFFSGSTYPEVFSEVCQKLKPGEVSEVMATDYGYQIFQLIEKRPPRQLSRQEADAKIRRALSEDGAGAGFEEWFANIKKKYDVKVDEKAKKEVTYDVVKEKDN